MEKYKKQTRPFIVPTTDGKHIEEHFGNASIEADISLARMIAPPGWSEPYQKPDFDEYTYVISGQKQIEVNGEKIILKEGESIRISRGTRVRYSNPFDAPCEYISVCRPPFSIDRVHREDSEETPN